jgi:hypothetical protein
MPAEVGRVSGPGDETRGGLRSDAGNRCQELADVVAFTGKA